MLNPRRLYHVGILQSRTGLFRSPREEPISVTTEPVSLRLITAESVKRVERIYTFMHLGLIVIGIKRLARKGLAIKILLALLDKRHSNTDQTLIATIEVDMNENQGIFYCSPDFMISLEDIKHIEIGIQTKGYEEFKGKNLVISIGFIGRMTNSSNTRYRVDIKPIIEAMTSKGIQLIKPLEISS